MGAAIQPDLANQLKMAGGFPLQPETLPGSAPVMGLPRLKCFQPGILVHVREHEDLTAPLILDYDGDQPSPFIKIRTLHHTPLTPSRFFRLCFRGGKKALHNL